MAPPGPGLGPGPLDPDADVATGIDHAVEALKRELEGEAPLGGSTRDVLGEVRGAQNAVPPSSGAGGRVVAEPPVRGQAKSTPTPVRPRADLAKEIERRGGPAGRVVAEPAGLRGPIDDPRREPDYPPAGGAPDGGAGMGAGTPPPGGADVPPGAPGPVGPDQTRANRLQQAMELERPPLPGEEQPQELYDTGPVPGDPFAGWPQAHVPPAPPGQSQIAMNPGEPPVPADFYGNDSVPPQAERSWVSGVPGDSQVAAYDYPQTPVPGSEGSSGAMPNFAPYDSVGHARDAPGWDPERESSEFLVPGAPPASTSHSAMPPLPPPPTASASSSFAPPPAAPASADPLSAVPSGPKLHRPSDSVHTVEPAPASGEDGPTQKSPPLPSVSATGRRGGGSRRLVLMFVLAGVVAGAGTVLLVARDKIPFLADAPADASAARGAPRTGAGQGGDAGADGDAPAPQGQAPKGEAVADPGSTDAARTAAQARVGDLVLEVTPPGARVFLLAEGPSHRFDGLPTDGEAVVLVTAPQHQPRVRLTKASEWEVPVVLDLDPLAAGEPTPPIPGSPPPAVGAGPKTASVEVLSHTQGARLGLLLGAAPSVHVEGLDADRPHRFLVAHDEHPPREVTVQVDQWSAGADGGFSVRTSVSLGDASAPRGTATPPPPPPPDAGKRRRAP